MHGVRLELFTYATGALRSPAQKKPPHQLGETALQLHAIFRVKVSSKVQT